MLLHEDLQVDLIFFLYMRSDFIIVKTNLLAVYINQNARANVEFKTT